MGAYPPEMFDEAAQSEGSARFAKWLNEKVGKATQITNPRQVPAQTITGFETDTENLPPVQVDPLVAAQKVAKDIPEAMSRKAGQIGGKAALGLMRGQGTQTGFERGTETLPQVSEEQLKQEHPIAAGTAEGVGEFTGEMLGDPRNAPFFLTGGVANPMLKRAMSVGFAGQMAKGTVEGIQQLRQNWDNLDPAERAKQVTKLGLGAAMTEEAGRHAVHANAAAAHGLDVTPNMHPDTAPKIVENTLSQGGSSIDPWTGKDLSMSRKTAISFASRLKVDVPPDQFNEHVIHAYANQPEIARILREPGTFIGTGKNEQTGMIEMEPSMAVSENSAKKFGAYFNQRGIFNFERKEWMPLEGTGEPENQPPFDPVERARMIAAEQPKPTRGLYRHHSDVLIKPDEHGVSTLTGTTRFASRIGQERGRSGEPGVYAYDMNTPAELGIRERQHEYRMIKDAALADASQEPYATIGREQGGHAVEKAIKADGYDGYVNSQVPGSVFFFGDLDARHVSKGPPSAPEELAAQRGSFTFDPSKKLGAGQLAAPSEARELQPGSPENIIAAGGGKFRGIQPGIPEAGLPDHALFDDASGVHGSTMMLPVDGLTPEAVAQKVASKRAEYGLPTSESVAQSPSPLSLGETATQFMKEQSLGEPAVEQAEIPTPGLTPEGTGISQEELARGDRGEKYFTISKGGKLTAHLSQPDAASDLKGGVVVKTMPDGSYDVQRGDSAIAEKYRNRVLQALAPPIVKAAQQLDKPTKVKLITTMPEIERQKAMASLNLDPTDFLMPEEKARMGNRAIAQLKKEYAALPPLEEAVAAAQAGLSGADWWRRGQQLYPILSETDPQFFPSDPIEQRKFANVMGATSPHQAVETAELEALHVWNQYRTKIVDAGKPITPANLNRFVKLLSLPSAKRAAVNAALMGQDVFGVGRIDRGLKRASMGQALGGGPEGSVPEEAYVGDTHMADLKGIQPASRVFNSAAAYYAMAAQDRAVARQLNMHVADVQAAQWSTKMAIQSIMGEMPDVPAETILGRLDAATINQYKKDLLDLMRTDPMIQKYMVEEYGFDPEKLAKLNVKLAAVPTETLGQSVPAKSLAPQLTAGVERLRPKYGKPVAPQSGLEFGPEGDESFNFGANLAGGPLDLKGKK